MLIAALALSALAGISCTPSPRYRGGKASQEPAPAPVRHEREPRRDLDIALRNPLGGAGSPKINSPFGMRSDSSLGTKDFHQGVDFEARTGDNVYAAAAGRVTFAGRQKAYGKIVIISHGNEISTVYAHLNETSVRRDQRVQAGEIVGKVGVSGNATGPHLHFELRISGEAVDPLDYMEIR